MGHVYVVRGKIGHLSCDMVLVPTDADFVVESYWSRVVGPKPMAPDGWASGSVAASADGVVFADVASGRDPAWLGRQVSTAIEVAAQQQVMPAHGRTTPLLAMPMVGIGRAGHGARIGEAIEAVLEGAREGAEAGIDVAIVIPDQSVYAAVQSQRVQIDHPTEHDDVARHLGALARAGQLAVVFGAGLSVGSGLPSWSQLLTSVSAGLEVPDGFDRLDDLDKAELLQLLIDEKGGTTLGELIVRAVAVEAQPSIAHALLASVGFPEAVTTNYDDLFEQALAAAGFAHNVVLPSDVPEQGAPWLLKLHGDQSRPDSLVLTRGSFVGFDAQARPAGAVLQSLLLTRHVLFVGVSMNDSNLLRLVHEVTSYVGRAGGRRKELGTLINIAPADAKRRLWKRDLRWLDLYQPEAPDHGRDAAIFLDAVAMYASSDRSWLLDVRFEHLLPEEAREDAQLLREIRDRAGRLGEPWRRIADDLAGPPDPETMTEAPR